MECMERFKKYEDEDLDTIMILIKNGTIKSGRYAGRIKLDKDFKTKGKELFQDGKHRSS